MRLLFILLLIIAITCIQLNQIGNLSLVLSTGGPDWSAVFGYDLKLIAGVSWAIGIELGVLVSVLAGAKKQAAILALGSCVINLLANQVWEYAPHLAAAKIVIYGLSAYLLWYFCELFAKYYANSFVNWFSAPMTSQLAAGSGALKEDSVNTAEKPAEPMGTGPVHSAETAVELPAKKLTAKSAPGAPVIQLSCQYLPEI